MAMVPDVPGIPANDWLQEIAMNSKKDKGSPDTEFLYRLQGETSEQADVKNQMFNAAIEPVMQNWIQKNGSPPQTAVDIEKFRRSSEFHEAIAPIRDKIKKGIYEYVPPKGQN